MEIPVDDSHPTAITSTSSGEKFLTSRQTIFTEKPGQKGSSKQC